MNFTTKTRRTKTASFELRMREDEKQGFRLAANLAGLSLSAWMRERLRESAARELEAEGQQIPFYQYLLEVHDV